MSYGIAGYSASGVEVFNTVKHLGVVYAGTITVPFQTTTASMSFPDFPGKTGLHFISTNRWSNVSCTWTYPGGIPTLSVTRTTTAWETSAPLSVFAFVR